MDGWQQFQTDRLQDLQTAYSMLQSIFVTKQLPQPADVSTSVVYTTLVTLVLCNLLGVLVLLPKGRRVIWDVLETILAILLIIALLIVILGLPFGEWLLHQGSLPAPSYVCRSANTVNVCNQCKRDVHGPS